MRIDKKMNLVIPIVNEKDEEIALCVHSTPISSEIFNKYFLVMGKAFSRIWSEGLGYVGCPRISDKILHAVAEEMGIWEGPTGVANGLIAEMQRLTNVIVATEDRGWEMLSLYDAKKTDVFSETEAEEVDSLITFFTLAWHLHRRTQFTGMTGTQLNMLGARIESLTCMELANSLRKSTPRASSGETAAA